MGLGAGRDLSTEAKDTFVTLAYSPQGASVLKHIGNAEPCYHFSNAISSGAVSAWTLLLNQ